MIRNAIAAIAAAALMCACASAGRGRDEEVRPAVREVKVPVPVPCKVGTPAKPAFAVDALPVGADIYQQTAALRAERKQRQGYELELESALAACIGAPAPHQEKTD